MNNMHTNNMLRELWPIFLVEVSEKLQAIDTLVTAAAKGTADIDALFREFHTLKSNFQMVDFRVLTELTHVCEDVLHGIRKTGAPLGKDIQQCLLDTADWCKQQLSCATPGHYPQQSNTGLIERLAPFASDTDNALEQIPEATPDDNNASQQADISPDEEKHTLAIESLRISGDTLDDLVTRINQLSLSIHSLDGFDKDRQTLQQQMADMQREMVEFQQAVMRLSVIPLSTIFTLLPRIVRKHASSSGKQVQMLVEDNNVAIDKGMVDAIADPLIRLLQQIISDNIEMPAVRQSCNKPETATIRIIASEHNKTLQLDITDDGVNSNYNNGGNKQQMQFPLTDAIQNSLIIRSAGQTFAIPTSHLLEIIDSPREELHIFNNMPTISLRGNTLPVYCLADLLQIEKKYPSPEIKSVTVTLLILQHNQDCIALAVDDLVGIQDLFPRDIHQDLRDIPGVNGVSILGDGSVIIILDCGNLFGLAAPEGAQQKGIENAS
jgi:chemotaxis protein histidine kinase CheA